MSSGTQEASLVGEASAYLQVEINESRLQPSRRLGRGNGRA